MSKSGKSPVSPRLPLLRVPVAKCSRIRLNLPQGSSMNAMSASPDSSQVVVAGHELIKIMGINANGEFEEQQSVRISKSKSNMSCIDVVWHPHESMSEEIATASSNGAVLVWDLSRADQRTRQVYQEYKRIAKCVCYYSGDPYGLLSGSQDRTVKRWDTRRPTSVATYDMKESVRHVTVNPHNPAQFACALENGNINLIDVRQDKQVELKIQAHQGPVYTIDWHPDKRNRLASGGRDKCIRIWDVLGTDGKKEKLSETIYTIASVAKVVWRPKHENHLSSCALVHDVDVHVWDLTRPYLPCLTFHEHRDVIVGIVWAADSGDVLVTSSKDTSVVRVSVNDALSPVDDAASRAAGVCFNPDGSMAVFSGKCPEIKAKRMSSYFLNKRMETSCHVATASNLYISNVSAINPMFETGNGLSDPFEFLARNYKYRGPCVELCEFNARLAHSVGCMEDAQTWRVIGVMWAPDATSASSAQIEQGPEDARGGIERTELEAAALQSDLPDMVVQKIFSNSDTDAVVFGPDRHLLSTEAFEERQSIPSSEDEADVDNDESDMDEGPLISIRPLLSARRKETIKVKVDYPSWSRDAAVRDLLLFLGDTGNVQLCTALMLVCGEALSKDVDELLQKTWFLAYCDLLDRRQLWMERAEVARLSHLTEINELLKESTTIPTGCGKCSKPLAQGWVCQEKCKSLTNPCTICHETVRGLYAWCQGCGHGGHLDHMQDWFSTERICPAGCGHNCVPLPLQ